MTPTQQKLVKAASIDPANSGTRWRDRMDAWLDAKPKRQVMIWVKPLVTRAGRRKDVELINACLAGDYL